MGINENNVLHWKFDVNAFRLIGRELITDRITAVFELVKNCFDANAEKVLVEFHSASSKTRGKILIIDNGHGMSFEDVKNKWMVVGTASKRITTHSPSPYNRRYIGEKGIGRFAVDRLGSKLNMLTKAINEHSRLRVEVDWERYEQLSKRTDELTLFSEVDNVYYFEKEDPELHYTELNITSLQEVWSKSDIDRLYKELSKLVSPFYPINPPFKIFIFSDEFPEYNIKDQKGKEVIKGKEVKTNTIQFASHSAIITFDKEKHSQETLTFNKETGTIEVKQVSLKSFGPVRIHLYFFDESAKKRFRRAYEDAEVKIDGVKIYRDGIMATPFAEFQQHPDLKRDILGIDKRIRRDIFNRISTREVIGIVDISKDENPKIIDATNRQDFVDNEEYRELKDFIIEQLDVFTEVRKFEREKRKVATETDLQKAKLDLNDFATAIEQIEKETPDLRKNLAPLKKQVQGLTQSVSRGIEEHQKMQKEFHRKENIYLSLMSMQDYAALLSHAVRTSLGKIKRMAEFIKTKFPDEKYNQYFKEYAARIYDEMNTLERVVNFMLSYAGSNLDFEEFSMKELVEDVMLKTYKFVFESEDIKPIVEFQDDFRLTFNKKFFEDILANLISNSIKALNGNEEKIIKCQGYTHGDQFILLFSDNGIGISPHLRQKVFNLFETTTADQGGGGVGLYVVKTRVEALKGSVEVVESEFGNLGATIKITLPFQKN